MIGATGLAMLASASSCGAMLACQDYSCPKDYSCTTDKTKLSDGTVQHTPRCYHNPPECRTNNDCVTEYCEGGRCKFRGYDHRP